MSEKKQAPLPQDKTAHEEVERTYDRRFIMGIADILLTVHRLAGSLPDGSTPETLGKGTVSTVLTAARTLADDKDTWGKIPTSPIGLGVLAADDTEEGLPPAQILERRLLHALAQIR